MGRTLFPTRGLPFEPEDQEGVTQKRVCSVFTKSEEEEKSFHVKQICKRQFRLVMKFMCKGPLFFQAAKFVSIMKEETGMYVYNGGNERVRTKMFCVIDEDTLKVLPNWII